MKRLRDDSCANPQFKRPCSSSRGESYSQSQVPPSGGGGGGSSTGGTAGGAACASASTQKLTTDDALSYLKKVKDMFQDRREKYDLFIDVMKDFKAQRIETLGVIARVKDLFKGHPNLILGFNTFLPKGYEITLTDEEQAPPKNTVELEGAIKMVNNIKRRFQNDVHVYRSFLDIMEMYKKKHKGIIDVHHEVAALFQDHPDLLDEFTKFLPNSSGAASAAETSFGQPTSHRYNDRSSAIPLLRKSRMDKQRFRGDRIVSPHTERDPSVEHPGMDNDRTTMKLHKEKKRRVVKENRERRNCDQDRREPDNENNGDNISMHHITDNRRSARKVEEFGGSCDDEDAIKSGFLKAASVARKKSLQNEGHTSKPVKEKEKDKEQKHEIDGSKEKDCCKEKYWGKSIQELDLSNCHRCTPSYRLLPEDYPIPTASERSESEAQVLNDHWVSMTSGSEDYSFKHMRRNQYEESLFRCEDDRFELDMLLALVSSTIERAEKLLNSLNDNSVGADGPICIEKHFTALNLRCIERLYGDHGIDVMDIFRRNPSLGLPVILTRLNQKKEEWMKCRTDFSKVWAEIYAKNHNKSLDHRSFYFKQEDSKNLSVKSFAAEIKEIKQIKQKEENMILAIAAGSRRPPISPHLEFEFADSEIHSDLYKLIKYSIEEGCSTEVPLVEVLRLWTTFLEPFFVVPNCRHGSEVATDDDVIPKNCITERRLNLDATTTNLKQSIVICNGDANVSPQQINSSRTSFTNIDASPKEDGFTGAGEHLISSNAAAAVLRADNVCIRPESRGARPGNGVTEDNIDDAPTSKGGDTSRSLPMTNNGFQDGASCNGSMQYHFNGDEVIGCQDASGENEMDAEDEDSENVSEAGEEVSGSESAADERSREELQEEDEVEDDELDGKVENEGEAEGTTEGNLCLLTSKPLAKHMVSPQCGGLKNNPRVFYGNGDFYFLFRLHQILYERLLSAKVNAVSSESKWRTGKDTDSDPYARFMSSLYSLLDGSAGNAKFEDDCRSIIGNQSYVLFTLDKLISKLVKQLQTVSSDELGGKLLQLYEYERSRKPEKYADSVYYENAHILLHGENLYRFECMSSPTRLSIQLIDDGSEKSEVVSAYVDPSFADYLHNGYLSIEHGNKESSAVMLKRNKRKHSDHDESSALGMVMENIVLVNGLECKMSSTSSKISYALDTEDFFYRLGSKRRNISTGRLSCHGQARVDRFHRVLTPSL